MGTSNNDDIFARSTPGSSRRCFSFYLALNKFCLVRQAPHRDALGALLLCGGHPLKRHEPADVVDKVLQANFDFRSRDADRPDNSATWRGLLCTEHVLDAGPNSALPTVRVLLRLR